MVSYVMRSEVLKCYILIDEKNRLCEAGTDLRPNRSEGDEEENYLS